jgi:hypothetical protein
MDQESQRKLATIVAAGPDSISEADAAFLRARSSYLSEEDRATFADILRGVAVEEASAEQPADEQPVAPAKKSRK